MPPDLLLEDSMAEALPASIASTTPLTEQLQGSCRRQGNRAVRWGWDIQSCRCKRRSTSCLGSSTRSGLRNLSMKELTTAARQRCAFWTGTDC